jgi:hypothetical protein
MNPVAIIGIALGVGLVAYALSLRTDEDALLAERLRRDRSRSVRGRRDGGEPRAVGFGPGEDLAPSDSFAYVPVVTTPATLRTRLMGLGGLILLVVTSAAVLALAIYQAGHVINQALARFLGK